jgi:hypothetical protein
MKQLFLGSLFFVLVCSGGVGITSCKNKAKDTTTNVDTSNRVNPLPVEVSSDDALRKGVEDALKDHPGVSATVSNGEITLSGTIERERWTKLNQTLMSLNPKKVNNQQLTIK